MKRKLTKITYYLKYKGSSSRMTRKGPNLINLTARFPFQINTFPCSHFQKSPQDSFLHKQFCDPRGLSSQIWALLDKINELAKHLNQIKKGWKFKSLIRAKFIFLSKEGLKFFTCLIEFPHRKENSPNDSQGFSTLSPLS